MDSFSEGRRLEEARADPEKRPLSSISLESKDPAAQAETSSDTECPEEEVQQKSEDTNTGGDSEKDGEEKDPPSRTQEKGWRQTYSALKTEDEAMKRDLNSEIDAVLVYAGLFSILLTVFISGVYQRLEGSNSDLSAQLLLRISMQLEGGTALPIPITLNSPPSANIIAINTISFASLVLTLSVLLFGIFAKQWVRTYSQWSSGGRPEGMLALRDFYVSAFEDWHVSDVIAALPILLQLALLLFFAGLILYLWTVNTIVAIVVTVLVAVVSLVAIVTVILPAVICSCPYKSPLGLLITRLRQRRSGAELNADIVPSTQSFSWKDRDLIHVTNAAKASSSSVGPLISKIGVLLNIRPHSRVLQALASEDLAQTVVGHRVHELSDAGRDALFDLVFSSGAEISGDGESKEHVAGFRRLLEYSVLSSSVHVIDMIDRNIKNRWPVLNTTSSFLAASFVDQCSSAWSWESSNVVNTTCLYYLNIAAEKLIEKISSADVPHDIATYRDRLYGISSVMQHWLSLASSITHPQVTKAMDLNAELILLHRTTSVRTDVIHGLPVEISVVAWADDGSAFGLGCTDGLVQVWQVSNIKRTAHMRDPHANPVRAVAFSPDHSLIASGSNDGTIYVWDIATETIKHTLSVHRQDISALAFSPDGLRIVSSAGFIAHVSDPSTGKTVSSVQDTQRISAVGFSADGKQIACGSDAGPIQICDAQTGSLVTRLDAPASVEALTFEGHKLVSRHQDNTTRTWDLEPLFSSEEPHTLTLVPEASASSLLTLGSDMRSLYARNITGDEQALIYRLRPGEQVTSTTERHGTKVVFGTLKGRIVLLDYNYVFPPFPSSKS